MDENFKKKNIKKNDVNYLNRLERIYVNYFNSMNMSKEKSTMVKT